MLMLDCHRVRWVRRHMNMNNWGPCACRILQQLAAAGCAHARKLFLPNLQHLRGHVLLPCHCIAVAGVIACTAWQHQCKSTYVPTQAMSRSSSGASEPHIWQRRRPARPVPQGKEQAWDTPMLLSNGSQGCTCHLPKRPQIVHHDMEALHSTSRP